MEAFQAYEASKQYRELKDYIYKMPQWVGSLSGPLEFWHRISYDRESKTIRHLKFLVEQSPFLQWWELDDGSEYCKKTIIINLKPNNLIA